METTRFDLVILGSGSAAFAAAIRAHEQGASVAMIERGTVGGTCVNVGCIPSKNLIEAARAYWEAQHPRFDGIAPAQPTLDFAALIAQACTGGKRTTEKVILQIKEWVKFASNRDVAKVPDDLTQDEAARVIASLTNLKDRK